VPPIVYSGTGILAGPLWTYTAGSSSTTTVTWGNQSFNVIPFQTVTFTSGVTSSPQWDAARARHVAYRQRNDATLRYFPPPREQWQQTREQIEAEDERQRQAREERDRRQAEWRENARAARVRAEELLWRFLSPAQRERYMAEEPFEVIGSAGTRFLITRRAIANITVVSPDGNPVADLCVHPSGDLPVHDIWLAQKLALETDEESFVGIANVHRGPPVSYVDGRMFFPGQRQIYGQTVEEVEEWYEDEVPSDRAMITVERRLA